VDPAYYDDLRGRLVGLLIRFSDRLDPKTLGWSQEYLEHNELGLALETMAYSLAEARAGLADDERSDILELARTMGMDDGVSTEIATCPPLA
jgi:hypothetical protein